MSVKIIVPSLGESVSEATVAKWYKKVGESVNVDELILELETEKVTLEVNASVSGVIESITKQMGASVEVGEVIGSIKEGAVSEVTPSPVKVEAKDESSILEVPVAPSAKKIAAENAIDTMSLKGSGKGGRITKGDVLDAISSTEDTSPTLGVGRVERVRMSRLRKTIAQRLKDSQNTAATLTTFNEIDMSNVMQMRTKYRDEFEKKHNVKLGFMSFFVKAASEALKEVASVNAEIDGDDIVYKNYYDIGVAVGTEQGLVVPILRDADKKTFAQIEAEISQLGKKARDGKLSMADLSGGTFSISNGGIYGSLLSTPIINPPQSGILGMHKIQERPVAINGQILIRPMMYVALSYDHRIIDGKEAVTFLVKIKDAIENPERLLFGL
ncbi:MAG: 2-oxoglutarate dehydrogenase complex dihydrolipoyllysine-residue succinyltransferase [Rickettsiaceae bacterium]|nr:2-oxoglutarate dehydrogenase complex dihydrolipoyllysine-residue succinyltransferase [Rickettsiaceae bacterium]